MYFTKSSYEFKISHFRKDDNLYTGIDGKIPLIILEDINVVPCSSTMLEGISHLLEYGYLFRNGGGLVEIKKWVQFHFGLHFIFVIKMFLARHWFVH